MSDEARLLHGEATDFERELLGSWDAEQPSDAARARTLAMVGLGAGAAGTAAAIAKAGAAAGGSIAPKAGAVGAAVLVKWLVIGAVGVATAGASLAYVRRTHRDPSAPAVVAGAVAPPPAVTGTALALPLAEAPLAPAPLAQEPTSRGASRRASSAERSAHASDQALGEEVSALDRAHRALSSGDAPAALRQIDEYEARFPRGALIEEAEALRIESLLAENDRASATRAGTRFLAAHPGSPHAARVRALLGQAPAP